MVPSCTLSGCEWLTLELAGCPDQNQSGNRSGAEVVHVSAPGPAVVQIAAVATETQATPAAATTLAPTSAKPCLAGCIAPQKGLHHPKCPNNGHVRVHLSRLCLAVQLGRRSNIFGGVGARWRRRTHSGTICLT
jgi:hypothetical protein